MDERQAEKLEIKTRGNHERVECPECGEVFLAELPKSQYAPADPEAAAGELVKQIYRQLEHQEGGCYNRLVKLAEERILAGSHAG